MTVDVEQASRLRADAAEEGWNDPFVQRLQIVAPLPSCKQRRRSPLPRDGQEARRPAMTEICSAPFSLNSRWRQFQPLSLRSSRQALLARILRVSSRDSARLRQRRISVTSSRQRSGV
ncbi:MAG: hypothetical protein VW552_03495, partial [Ilumatobacter sp.]